MVGARIGRYKMAKHFTWEIKGGNITFSRNAEEIAREQALGTLCRTTVLVGEAKMPIIREGEPDAYQSKVFELLAADGPT